MHTESSQRAMRLLIFVNLVTVALAVFQQWNMGTLLWTYWTQSVIIGAFQFKKITDLKQFSVEGFKINGVPAKATAFTKWYTAIFFMIHFGLFHFVYAGFLLGIASNAHIEAVAIATAMFAINHLVSYIENKATDAKKVKNIGTMMFFPYARIIPMHLIIILGFTLSFEPIAIVIFLLLKTVADVVMHNIEHKA